MRIISWEEYTDMGSGEWGVGSGECAPLAITIGVFDGVHRGHQALIQRICTVSTPPDPRTSIPTPYSLLPPEKSTRTGERVDEQRRHGVGQTQAIITTKSEGPPTPYTPAVITFRQNPQQILKPDAFAGDILNLEQKLRVFEVLGVQLAVLIDFSEEFSKINGRAFIDLLLNRPVKLIALGRNFRCGYRLDTGAEEIRNLAGTHGTEVWVAPPVMDEGQPVSSSRIRQALAAGRQAEAERLLGWPEELAQRITLST